MSAPRCTRRALLSGAFTTSAAWLVGCGSGPRPEVPPSLPTRERLVALTGAPSAVAVLGSVYLWQTAPRPPAAELVTRVLPGPLEQRLSTAPRWELRRAVCERIEADFAGGHPVAVGGWLLAETEACLAALAVADLR